MSLINLLSTSGLGLGGALPFFKTLPNPPGSLHKTYSIDGSPMHTSIMGINPVHPLPMPSRLDEWDSNNTNKYKSRQFVGMTYMDSPPH